MTIVTGVDTAEKLSRDHYDMWNCAFRFFSLRVKHSSVFQSIPVYPLPVNLGYSHSFPANRGPMASAACVCCFVVVCVYVRSVNPAS